MSHDPHMVGFEREEYAKRAFAMARGECPILKHRTFLKIIETFRPDFVRGLYEAKPCHRRVRYTCQHESLHDPQAPPFRNGQIYDSEEFNGATYKIKGHDRRIGRAYFEVVG